MCKMYHVIAAALSTLVNFQGYVFIRKETSVETWAPLRTTDNLNMKM